MDEHDMEPESGLGVDFYRQVVELSKKTSVESLLRKDTDAVFTVVVANCRECIQAAAQRGASYAYLLIYAREAKLYNIVPIDNHLRPDSPLVSKLQEAGLDPVIQRLRKYFHPFAVEIQEVAPQWFAVTARWSLETEAEDTD